MPRVKLPTRHIPINQEPNFIEQVVEVREGRPPLTLIYDKTRFPTALKVDRYDNFYQKHVVVCERDVVLIDFDELGIMAEMEMRGWVLFLQNGGEAVIDMVRQIYSNAEIVNRALKRCVREIHIDVGEEYIREIRGEVPRVPNPTYRPRKNVMMNVVGKELTGVRNFSWTGTFSWTGVCNAPGGAANGGDSGLGGGD